ncbi:hypothetical protein IQ06DRAFT_217416 [Phaeosphaeriaceae sp. SRC1lsM3a]|nr:hypothetical protein IQ06DRAFT_217416 [Stagonospora sp. SRC1lsM3a]
MSDISKSPQEGGTNKGTSLVHDADTTHQLTSPVPRPALANTPLPHRGAALFEAFHTYKPPTAFTAVANGRSLRALTWSFLQDDQNCQELSELLALLGTIFAYSRREHWNDLSKAELAAGFRYFIPTGNLAREWIQFFDIAPARYLEMAPPEVQYAYQREHDWDTCSMRQWVQAGVDYWKLERDRVQAAKRFYNTFVPASATLGNKRRRRGDGQDDANSSLSQPRLHTGVEYGDAHARIDPSRFLGSSQVARGSSLFRTGSHVQTTPFPGPSTISAPSMASKPSAASIQNAAASSQASHIQKALVIQQASAIPPAHLGQKDVQHVAPTSAVPPLHTYAPASNAPPRGSQVHRGKGFFHRGWSDDRVRAFTDIQGKSIAALPSAANSPWGDEMSRSHTPKSVDLRLCPFETTMEENLTYFTLATTANRQLCSRTKASWTAQECVHYVYWCLDLRESATYGRTTVQKQFAKCKEWEELNPGLVHTASMSSLRTDSNLSGADATTHDFFLHAMGKNVANHPEGKGEHILTRVIRHVLDAGDENVRLSDAARYAELHGIKAPDTNDRLLATPVTDDGPDGTTIATARAAYVVKFGKPA